LFLCSLAAERGSIILSASLGAQIIENILVKTRFTNGRSKGGGSGGQKKPYTVGFFGSIALAGAILVYLFSTTFDPTSFNQFLVMLSILIAGVLLSVTMVGVKFMPFNMKNLLTDLLSTGVAFVSIYVISGFTASAASATSITAGQSPIGPISFGILSGVAEGWFFHLWLVAWLSDLASPWVGVPASSLVWAIFHVARYGGSVNLDFSSIQGFINSVLGGGGMLLTIFIVGLPLGALTIYFRSNDGPVFGHMLANALVGRA
jgi:hypothetical protein